MGNKKNSFLTNNNTYIIAIPTLAWTAYASTMFLFEYIHVFGSRRYADSPVNISGIYGQDNYYLLIVFGLLFTSCFILTLVSFIKKIKKLLLFSVFIVLVFTLLTFFIVDID